jgi:hypothetical protein
MEIKYQLAPRDLEALNAFAYRGTVLGLMYQRAFQVVGLVIVGASAFVMALRNPSAMVWLLVFLAFFAFFWGYRHQGLRKRGTAVFAPNTLVTSPEWIESLAPGQTFRTAWDQIQGFAETTDHVFVMLDGLAGYVVPKRQLSKDDLETFLGELRQRTHRLPGQPASQKKVVLLVVLAWLALALVFFTWHMTQLMRKH